MLTSVSASSASASAAQAAGLNQQLSSTLRSAQGSGAPLPLPAPLTRPSRAQNSGTGAGAAGNAIGAASSHQSFDPSFFATLRPTTTTAATTSGLSHAQLSSAAFSLPLPFARPLQPLSSTHATSIASGSASASASFLLTPIAGSVSSSSSNPTGFNAPLSSLADSAAPANASGGKMRVQLQPKSRRHGAAVGAPLDAIPEPESQSVSLV